MATTIVCPSCQRRGSLPDTFRGGKVRCPSCGVVTEVAVEPAAAPAPRPSPTLPPRASARPSPASRPPHPREEEEAPSGISPAVYAAIAAAGVLGVLLVIGVALLMGRPGATAPRPSPKVEPEVASVKAPDAPADAGTGPAAGPDPSAPAAPEPAAPTATSSAAPEPVAARESPRPAEVEATSARPARPSAPANESPAETVRRIKEATVFIKVRAADGVSSGSGFVIRADGDSALIATNHHVISGGKEDDEPDPPGTPAPAVTAVLRSGSGPGREQALPAVVVATDRTGSRDLAILRVRGVRDMPRPIVLDQPVDLVETMPVLIYGFPFGEMERMLGASHGNPAITINKGSVSSIKRTDFREVSLVQIDGSLNPGNSGGPVVDDQGRLVGVSVAQIQNTTIGFAVPAAELTRMLDGRLGRLRLTLASRGAGMADLRVDARVIDPQKRIRLVRLTYVRADAVTVPPSPGPEGSWPALPGTRSVDLAMADRAATGHFLVPVAGPADRRLLVQMSHVDTSGRQVYAAPEPFEVPESPGAPAIPGGPAKGDVVLTLEKLDPIANAKDCTSTRDDKGITIKIPGTLHMLNPELKLKNAPMMVGDIEGDFVARVKIPGTLQPGAEPVRKMPITFHGAGLLLWQDANNFLRLERTAGTAGGAVLVHRILMEACSNGKLIPPFYMDFPEMPLYLQIVRAKGGIHCMFGPDGKKWIALKKLAVEYPDKVRIGISAANTSKKPFPARFEEFLVLKPKPDAADAETP